MKKTDDEETDFDIDWLGELEEPEGLVEPKMMFFYGESGHGKTRLAGTLSEVDGYYPVLFIDTEQSVRGTLSEFDKSRVRVKTVHSVSEFDKVIRGLLDKEHPFKTIVIDTMSTILKRKELDIFKNPPKTQSGAEDTNKAWNQLLKYTTAITDALRMADFNVVMNFHQKIVEDDAKRRYSVLNVNGSSKHAIMTAADIIGLITIDVARDGTVTRKVQMAPADKKATKSRYESMNVPLEYENPHMGEIIGQIRKNSEKKEVKNNGE